MGGRGRKGGDCRNGDPARLLSADHLLCKAAESNIVHDNNI